MGDRAIVEDHVPDHSDEPRPAGSDTREERLAAALRDNLRRRKEQARSREEQQRSTEPDDGRRRAGG